MCGSVAVGEKSHRIFIEFVLIRENREGTSSVTLKISNIRANKQMYFDEIYL